MRVGDGDRLTIEGMALVQGDALWRPVCPINLGVEAEYGKACPGQDNEVDNDLRASGSELAVANRCRGTLIAAIRAVEIGADGHVASNTWTEGK